MHSSGPQEEYGSEATGPAGTYISSPNVSLEDEEDFIDDNSSTSTAGPPPDSPQSTGRFGRPWNLATAQSYGSEAGSSATSSIHARASNHNNRTGSFRPLRDGGSPQATSSSGQNTGTFLPRGIHSRTCSGTSTSASPMGSSSPQEFGRSFRLFCTSRSFGMSGGGSASRNRERSTGTAYANKFRSTRLRNMDVGGSGRQGGVSDPFHNRSESSVYHQRQSSLFATSFGNNPNGSVSPEPRGGSVAFGNAHLGLSMASGLGASASPLLGGGQSPRWHSVAPAALELTHYAMGGGQLVSSTATAMQRKLPALLCTLRSHLSLNGQTILVGDATHPLEIKRGGLIGAGGFAKVFVGLNTCRGELVAIKEIQVVDVDDVYALREIEQEFALLRCLRHPNIVSYHLFEHSRSQKVCRIMMEFLAGDSTFHLLQKFGPLSETILRRITRHLLNAISYIHREGIFHRDIKPANILVSHTGDVKLCDFGCSKRISELSKAASCIIGTPVYMAPELIKGEATHKADIWSMGCTLFELATGLLPWYHSGVKDNLPLMFYITTTYDSPLVLPSPSEGAAPELSSEFTDFMEMCFTRDPARRPEARDLLRHPWITGARPRTPNASGPSSFTPAWALSSQQQQLPPNFLSLAADSRDTALTNAATTTTPLKDSAAGGCSPYGSAVALSNDSFNSDLAATRLSASMTSKAASPAAQEAVVEDELQCQHELEEVSASTAVDLCNALMNFPEHSVKRLERRLLASGQATGATLTAPSGSDSVSPPITRTFSVPSPSLTSHRATVSMSIGDVPSPGLSPEHSILHDNFHYSQAQLGTSAGNFVLPAEVPDVPAQQYLRINDEGKLDFATIHEPDADLMAESGNAKSFSTDSNAFFGGAGPRPGYSSRAGSMRRSSASRRAGFNATDRWASAQWSAANSGHFPSPRGESPSRMGSAGAYSAAGSSISPPPAAQGGAAQPPHAMAIPTPPAVPAARGTPPSPSRTASPRLPLLVAGSSSLHGFGEEHVSSPLYSPTSSQTPWSASFRHLPENAKVASDGKLHLSFLVSTNPGEELTIPLSVDVNDVHCKMVDNQPSYVVAFSTDIKEQIASKIKEAAAHPTTNSPAVSVTSRTTTPPGLGGQSGGSGVSIADLAGSGAHQRVLSSSGAHFYNTPSYHAARSPARPLSRLSAGNLSSPHLQQQLQPRQQQHNRYSQPETPKLAGHGGSRTVSPVADGASYDAVEGSEQRLRSRTSSPEAAGAMPAGAHPLAPIVGIINPTTASKPADGKNTE